MPAIDPEYILRLDDFTKALGGIVELLKNDDKKKNVDNVNAMLTNMDEGLKSVVKNMEKVLKSTTKIESQNDKILQEIKASRKAKETGVFGEIAETDNKKKIIDAVKVIGLISVGILAMGLAFKIIGKVDFVSVIAIGLGIVFAAGAFVMVSDVTDGLSVGDVAVTSGIMFIMAGALTLSSWILAAAATFTLPKALSISFVAIALGAALSVMSFAIRDSKIEPKDYGKFLLLPIILPVLAMGIAVSSLILSAVSSLSFQQSVTTVFVAAALGASLYFMSKAIESSKIEPKDSAKFFMLPLILPALAMGLVASSFILKGIQVLSFMQMVSAIFIAVTLGVLVYLMKPLIVQLKDMDSKDVWKAGGIIVSLSVGLVAASQILRFMHFFTFKESLAIAMSSLAIGLAVLFLTPAVYILKSIKEEDMTQAAANIVIAASAIFLSSILLSLGKYDNVPDWQWTIGAGLSITAFAGIVWVIKKMNMTSTEFFVGAGSIIVLSAVISLSSWILSVGNYGNYPDVSWSAGVGLSLIAFGVSTLALGFILTASGGSAAGLMAIGALATLLVAGAIVGVSLILAQGEYRDYPSFEWAAGVGLSIVTFGAAMAVLGILSLAVAVGYISMVIIANTIVEVAKILSKGEYSKFPGIEWVQGAGLSMIGFGTAMTFFTGPMFVLLGFGALSMALIAGTIVGVSKILSSGTYENGNDIYEWTKGVGLTIAGFGLAMIMVGPMIILLGIGSLSMTLIANTILSIDKILSTGSYKNAPDNNWATGVSEIYKAITPLAVMVALVPKEILNWGLEKMASIADTIVKINEKFKGVDFKNGPTKDWAEGVGISIKAFAEGIVALESTTSLLDIVKGNSYDKKITGIADAMIKAAKTLGSFNWTEAKNYPSKEWAEGVGIAIKTFAEGIAALEDVDSGMFNDNYETKIKNLATAIKSAAVELSTDGKGKVFDWSKMVNFPTEPWTTGVSKALKAFIDPIVELAKADITGNEVSRNIKIISNGLVSAAEIIGKYEGWINAKFPDPKWTTGVGEALKIFVEYLKIIENEDIGRSDVRVLNRIADSMVYVSNRFKGVSWGNPPDSDWGLNIEKSITGIVNAIKVLDDVDDFDSLVDVASSMVEFTKKLEKIIDKKNIYVENGLFDNFGKSMKKLIESFSNSQEIAKGVNALGDALFKISNMGSTTGDSIKLLTKSILDLSKALEDVDTTSMDKLSKFSNGILVLSLIDEKKFEDAISILDKKKNDITSIFSDNNVSRGSSNQYRDAFINVNKEAEDRNKEIGEQESKNNLYNSVTSISSQIGELVTNTKGILDEIQKDKTPPVAGTKTTDKK